jgi:hypothetical protein
MADNVATSIDTSNAQESLLQMITGYWVSKAVYVAAKLGIAACSPVGRFTMMSSRPLPAP